MSWRQQVQLYWQGLGVDGISEKSTSFHTQANPSPSFGPAGALIDAMQALSVGAIKTKRIAPVEVTGAVPGPGSYSSTRDYATIYFRASSGQEVQLTIAAPRSDIWTPGTDRINLAHPDVITLVNAAIAALSSGTGSPVVSVSDGRRYKIKL